MSNVTLMMCLSSKLISTSSFELEERLTVMNARILMILMTFEKKRRMPTLSVTSSIEVMGMSTWMPTTLMTLT